MILSYFEKIHIFYIQYNSMQEKLKASIIRDVSFRFLVH
jgi:hypothetical protein